MLQWQFFEQYQHEPAIAVARFWIAYSEQPRERTRSGSRPAKSGYVALDAMERHLSERVPRRRAYSLADISLYAYTHVAHEGGSTSSRIRHPRVARSRRGQPGHVAIDA